MYIYIVTWKVKVKMASGQDSDSDMELLSDLLDCDVSQLRAMDETRVQNELDRLRTSVADENRKFKCSKCDAVFSYAKTLNKHVKNNTCSKKSFVCQNCGKTYKKRGLPYQPYQSWEVHQAKEIRELFRAYKIHQMRPVRNCFFKA